MTNNLSTTCLSERDFDVPIDDRYFEDYVPGSTYQYGHIVVTEPEILDFAHSFDPQPIHLDSTWSVGGPFGGLIASGWHTGSLCMRMFVDHYVSHVACLASPGMDELRWPRPVRPGDALSLKVTIESARLTKSRPDRGLVHSSLELLNQDDELAMSVTAMTFFGLRHPVQAQRRR